jgi:hypothetical protein
MVHAAGEPLEERRQPVRGAGRPASTNDISPGLPVGVLVLMLTERPESTRRHQHDREFTSRTERHPISRPAPPRDRQWPGWCRGCPPPVPAGGRSGSRVRTGSGSAPQSEQRQSCARSTAASPPAQGRYSRTVRPKVDVRRSCSLLRYDDRGNFARGDRVSGSARRTPRRRWPGGSTEERGMYSRADNEDATRKPAVGTQGEGDPAKSSRPGTSVPERGNGTNESGDLEDAGAHPVRIGQDNCREPSPAGCTRECRATIHRPTQCTRVSTAGKHGGDQG